MINGFIDGLTVDGDQLWNQDTEEIESQAESGDEFGDSLAVR